MSSVIWISPDVNLGLTQELDQFTSPVMDAVYETPGTPTMGDPDPPPVMDPTVIAFELIGTLPLSLAFNQTTNIVSGPIAELDSWYPGFSQPDGFKYDTATQSGGNYGKYGSALAGMVTVTFTIRAYHDTLYNPEVLDPTTYADRIFSLTIENNYSSDRDNYIIQAFQGQTISYNGQQLTPEEWIAALKEQGFYT